MARVSPNLITSLTQDWGLDTEYNNYPFSGANIQKFIKENLGAIARASYFDSPTATIYYFASEEDKQEYILDPQSPTNISKILFSTGITLASKLYRIELNNGEPINTLLNVATNQESIILSMPFEVLERDLVGGSWQGVTQGVNVTAYYDMGATGEFTPIGLPTFCSYGTVYQIDVRNYLTERNGGLNRIKLTFVSENDENIVRSIIYTVKLTAMYIEIAPDNRWYVPLIEDGLDVDYQLGGFYIAGSLLKELHVDIFLPSSSGSGPKKSFEYHIGPDVYVTYPFFYGKAQDERFSLSGLDTGIYVVSLYLTATVDGSTLTSEAVTYNIMYVAHGNRDDALLICMNNAVDSVYNYTEDSRLFDYSVYNKGDGTAQPEIEITGHIGDNGTNLNAPPIGIVETSKLQSYVFPLSWYDSSHLLLSMTAKLEFGGIEQMHRIAIDNSLSFPPSAGYDFYMNSSTRRNTESGRLNIVNNVENNTYYSGDYWTDMVWVDGSDGWTTDDTGKQCLLIPAKSKFEFPYTDYRLLSDPGSLNGETIELCYKVRNVSDYDETVISIASGFEGGLLKPNFKGIRIKPTNITVHSNDESQLTQESAVITDLRRGTNVMDETIIHFVLVIKPNAYTDSGGNRKNLVTGYVNGCKNFQFEFSNNANWSTDGSLIVGGNKSDVCLYFVRKYNRALDDTQVTNNYISSLGSITAKLDLASLLKSVTDEGQLYIDIESVKNNNYNYFVVEMDNGLDVPSAANGWSDGMTGLSNLEMHFGQHPEWDWKICGVSTEGQGTTSMRYFRWNVKWRIDREGNTHGDKKALVYYTDQSSPRYISNNSYKYEWQDNGAQKSVYFDGNRASNGHPPVKRITAKINFASSMQSHKIGATLAYTELHDAIGLRNEAQSYADGNNLPRPTVSVYQYPAFGFQKKDNVYTFIGLFTIGPDKGDKATFGYDIDGIKEHLITLEGTDHNRDVVVFNYPWDDNITPSIKYKKADECLGIGDGQKRGGWEVGNCYDLDDESESFESDVLSKLEEEFKPAYDVVYNNSTMIFGIGLDEGYGIDAASILNNINSNISTFINTTHGNNRLPNRYYQFWIDGNSTLYCYDPINNIYIDSGTNVGTPQGSTVEEKNEWIKEQRRNVFKSNAGNYWDIQDAIYHYAFILIMGAIDNFAKNSYPYKMADNPTGLWRWRQDDLDSILGINNSGIDTVPESSEYEDSYSDGSMIYNGSLSAFWTLIHECYMEDYEENSVTKSGIRSTGKAILDKMANIGKTGNTITGILQYFKKTFWDNAQNYFPSSAYNIDGTFKYISAWLNHYEDQALALPQSLGNHYSAEYKWVYNRIIYLLSWFRAGPFNDSTDKTIGFIAYRPANNVDLINITYAKDTYPSISDGESSSFGTRTLKGGQYSFRISSSGNTTYYITGSDVIKSLGNLKTIQVAANDTFGLQINGRKLESFDMGGDSGVTTNIPSVSFENTPCLESINLKNASSINTPIDVSSCTRLQTADFRGTNSTAITLGDGLRIREIYYPDTISSLVIKNLRLLQEAHIHVPLSLSNLETLKVVNCNLDAYDTLMDAMNSSNSRLKNFDIRFSEIKELQDHDLLIITNIVENSGQGEQYQYHGVSDDDAGSSELLPRMEGTVLIATPIHTLNIDDLLSNNRGRVEGTETYNGVDYTKLRITALNGLYILYDPNNVFMNFADTNTQSALLVAFGNGALKDSTNTAVTLDYNDGILLSEAHRVASISASAFANNTNIASFDEFQEFINCTTIGASAFEGCTSLSSIIIPDNVTSIGAKAFYNTGFTSATISGAIDINEGMFYLTPLDSFTLEGDVTIKPSINYAIIGGPAINAKSTFTLDLSGWTGSFEGSYRILHSGGTSATSPTINLYLPSSKITSAIAGSSAKGYIMWRQQPAGINLYITNLKNVLESNYTVNGDNGGPLIRLFLNGIEQTTLIIPNTVENLSVDELFILGNNNSTIKTLKYEPGVELTNIDKLSKCLYWENIFFPPTVNDVSLYIACTQWRNNTIMKYCVLTPTTPPIVNTTNEPLNYVSSSQLKIIVPKASLSVYQADSKWGVKSSKMYGFLEVTSAAALPSDNTNADYYLTQDTIDLYEWNGSAFVKVA